ncbi:MAG: NAD(+) synthase [Anaerolineae bacterium]|nr:NAD(+) synthase [Anaerolineae bacterium]
MSQAKEYSIDLRIDGAPVCDEIVNFVSSEVQRRRRRGVVIGLSGGLDSSTCAYICTRALGKSRVLGLFLPERDSDSTNMMHAQLVASNLDIPTDHVDISPILDQIGVYNTVDREIASDRARIEKGIRWFTRLTRGPSAFSQALHYAYGERDTLWARIVHLLFWRQAGRMQSFLITKVRTRMLLLSHCAALHDYAIVGTLDKSEQSIGFYDPHGDGVCDLALLQHLYKTQIRDLGRYLGVPEAILSKPSSGDLAAGLPNEVAIGLSYRQLDTILLGIALRLPDEAIAREAQTGSAAVRAIEQAVRLAGIRNALPRHL